MWYMALHNGIAMKVCAIHSPSYEINFHRYPQKLDRPSKNPTGVCTKLDDREYELTRNVNIFYVEVTM